MKKIEKNLLFFSNFLVIVSGVLYAYFIYFVKPDNEWDVISHPIQAIFQAMHILVSPLLILAFGMIWSSHIQVKLLLKELTKKRSGLLLLFLFLIMLFSGYGIQVTKGEFLRKLVIASHLVSSFFWIIIFFLHSFYKKF